MQYVWQHRLWTERNLHTGGGERVEILDPGLINRDSGPDFFNAKVRIGDRVWVGNVELHVRASDWHRHGHDADKAYHSVILHVVAVDDDRICRPDGREIPQIVMPCTDAFRNRYDRLVNSPLSDLACADTLKDVPGIYISDWLTALAMERLQEKAARIAALAAAEGGDWQSAVYITLARTLGFSKNNDAFERLALSTPLRILRKHADNPVSIEAMLMGQAGFLDDVDDAVAAADIHLGQLAMEYRFMKAKFGLQQPQLAWKMGRMRPYNFPQRRVATLAQYICRGFTPGGKMLAVKTAREARELFDIILDGYWAHRVNFGPECTNTTRAFSESNINILIINVLVPAIYAYGLTYGIDEMMGRATAILQSVPPEENAVTRLFTAAGIKCGDAFASQALIQLRRAYCEPRKCLYCRFGHRHMSPA
ncbi:MAG: DUF2851 family protein [Roseburia sp.]|nr:DUF2851 family protein [Roseburia sp.]